MLPSEKLNDKIFSLTYREQLALIAILDALDHAKKKHPDPWEPTRNRTGEIDVIHAAAVVNEEAGELIRDAVTYREKDKSQLQYDKMLKEAAQTGCTAIRFLSNTINETSKYFSR